MSWLTYFGALLWGFVLLASFAGYGTLIGRVLGFRLADDGLKISWGLSFFVVAGGPLNLVRVISAPLVVGMVLGGVVAWLAQGGPFKLLRAARRFRGWDYVLLSAMLIAYVNWLCFNQIPAPTATHLSHRLYDPDDSPYTLYPMRMLKIGHMGIDPFSDRISASSLGGESFLQTLVLAVLPVDYIHLIDPGLAFLAMGVLFLSMRRLSTPARGMLALLFATHPTMAQNVSAIALPVVLLVAMARVLARARPTNHLRSCAGVALLLAALMALKQTLIPGSALVVVIWGVILALTTRRLRPLLSVASIALFTCLLLLPWMVCCYESAGTLLYPILGAGFRGQLPQLGLDTSGYWSRASIARSVTAAIAAPQILGIVGGFVVASVSMLSLRTSSNDRAVMFACCMASLVTMGVYVIIFRIEMMWRYFYPFAAFSNIIAYGTILRLVPRQGSWRLVRAATYVVMGAFIVHNGVRDVRRSSDLPECIAGALAGRVRFDPEQVDRYRRIQAAIPPSNRFFCTLDWPILFDLTRNDIYCPDNIGEVSPPPGMPLSRGPDEFATYLRSVGIRYVASPTPALLKASFAEAERELQKNRGAHPALQRLFANYLSASRLICAIIEQSTPLYDDGEVVVIDLLERGVVKSAASEPAKSIECRGHGSSKSPRLQSPPLRIAQFHGSDDGSLQRPRLSVGNVRLDGGLPSHSCRG